MVPTSPSTDAAIADLLWDQVKDSLYITREQYLQGLEGWTIEPHDVDGEMVGAVLTKGPELHFATFGKKWSMTRADLRHYLNPLLARYCHVLTKTPKESERQHRFNRLIGFVPCGEDEFFIHYKLERLRHA